MTKEMKYKKVVVQFKKNKKALIQKHEIKEIILKFIFYLSTDVMLIILASHHKKNLNKLVGKCRFILFDIYVEFYASSTLLLDGYNLLQSSFCYC